MGYAAYSLRSLPNPRTNGPACCFNCKLRKIHRFAFCLALHVERAPDSELDYGKREVTK
jgi:hypothetical protein